MQLTDDIEIFHDGWWGNGEYHDTGYSISINCQCSKKEAEQLKQQIIDSHAKVGWLFRTLYKLKNKNKRLREQLLDTDKRNIHIRPSDWNKILGYAEKWRSIVRDEREYTQNMLDADKNGQIVKKLKRVRTDTLAVLNKEGPNNMELKRVINLLDFLLEESKK